MDKEYSVDVISHHRCHGFSGSYYAGAACSARPCSRHASSIIRLYVVSPSRFILQAVAHRYDNGQTRDNQKNPHTMIEYRVLQYRAVRVHVPVLAVDTRLLYVNN